MKSERAAAASAFAALSPAAGSAALNEALLPPATPTCLPGKQQCRNKDQETNGKNLTCSSSDFSDPVYKEIAITNGCINRMTRDELRKSTSIIYNLEMGAE
uniref:Uncharacterized protein n=1 Tax=Dromaius novaehollandiae TaxID=8790 RepID=A0A8C4JCH8_DRONO